MVDKRIYKRANVILKASFTIPGIHEASQASIVNISAEGFCFSCTCEIPIGTDVLLSMELNNEEIALNVKVVWCSKDNKSGSYHAGVNIIEEIGTDFEKFLIFYCKKAYKSSNEN